MQHLAIVEKDENGNLTIVKDYGEISVEYYEDAEDRKTERIESIEGLLSGLFQVGAEAGVFEPTGINKEAISVGRIVNGLCQWIDEQKEKKEKLPDMLNNTLVLTALKALRKSGEPSMRVNSQLLTEALTGFFKTNCDLIPGLPEWVEQVEEQMMPTIIPEEVKPAKTGFWN